MYAYILSLSFYCYSCIVIVHVTNVLLIALFSCFGYTNSINTYLLTYLLPGENTSLTQSPMRFVLSGCRTSQRGTLHMQRTVDFRMKRRRPRDDDWLQT